MRAIIWSHVAFRDEKIRRNANLLIFKKSKCNCFNLVIGDDYNIALATSISKHYLI
jgi:hypothetical protein